MESGARSGGCQGLATLFGDGLNRLTDSVTMSMHPVVDSRFREDVDGGNGRRH